MDYNKILWNPPQELLELIKATASDNRAVREEAQHNLAKAIEMPLRQGVLYGDVVRHIYQAVPQGPGQVVWPLDILSPGREDEFAAYTSPGVGRVAERKVEGDYVSIPTYQISNSIQWELRFARDAGWPVIARALQILEAGIVQKINNDGWYTILTAGYDRNLLAYDPDASAGQFTKRLVSIIKTIMIRNGGGNSASLRHAQLTDLYLSPESIEDVRSWGLGEVDDTTRREIYVSADGGPSVTRVFGVNLNPLYEFGPGNKYQSFYTDKLGGSLQSSDVELVVGLDLVNKDSFVMPVRQEVQVFPDSANLHRRGEDGYYANTELGFAVLDNRRVTLASY